MPWPRPGATAGKPGCCCSISTTLKDINDTLGHTAGDRLLVEVARRLDACVRASDTAARLGGDELALILTELRRPEDAAVVARNAMQVMAQPFRLAGREMHATTSIGIAVYPDDGEDADQLLRAADMALYQAKGQRVPVNGCETPRCRFRPRPGAARAAPL